MTDLNGLVALVVGAGSPQGRAAARVLAAAGARLAINDWTPDAAEKLVAEIGSAGGSAHSYPADASKKLAFQTALERVLEDWGRLDVLVNATAVQPAAPILELDEWDWRRALELNLGAAFFATQSVGRVMRQLGGGLIINLVASPSRQAAANSAAYTAAAGGLEALTAAAAAEFTPYNLRVESLHLADNEADLRAGLLPLCRELLLQRTGHPESE